MARNNTHSNQHQRRFFPTPQFSGLTKAEMKRSLESSGHTNVAYQGHTRNERNPERGFYAVPPDKQR